MKRTGKILLYTLGISLGLLCLGFIVSLVWVGYYTDKEVDKTFQMKGYEFKSAFADSVPLKVEYQWIPLDSISRNLIIAVLAVQDKNFYVNNGFQLKDGKTSSDILSVDDLSISQKTAKSVFLNKSNSVVNSWLRDYFTILEETLWSKDRILEVYLNTAPLGHGIFGAEAASQIYFGKSAGYLTREEAAFIALLYIEPRDEKIDFAFPEGDICSKQFYILTKMSLMTQIKIGKKPVDETIIEPTKPIYKRNWKG